MASIQLLKRRIRAAQNVSKTTKAMQLIAASKLKRAQDATMSSRPYVEKLSEMTTSVASKILDKSIHPYLETQADNTKSLVIVLASDKGLCGGLITNLLREFLRYNREEKDSSYIVVGKKVEAQITRLSREVIAAFPFGTTLPTFEAVYPIMKLIEDYYLTGKVASVKILYTKFNNMFSQSPQIQQVLPIALPEEDVKSNDTMLIEPTENEILPSMLKHYVEMTIFQGLLESYVSYQAAQMIAMQNATNNARDIIDSLLLEYNKTRQERITNELLDISSGRH